MQSRFKRLALAVPPALAVLLPLAAAAGTSAIDRLRNSVGQTGEQAGIASGADLPTLIGGYISAALGLLGVVLVCLVIYAGFLWMTAQGNEDKVKKAKGMIQNAVIGLVIIFAAYAIATFVINAVQDNAGGAGSGTVPSDEPYMPTEI